MRNPTPTKRAGLAAALLSAALTLAGSAFAAPEPGTAGATPPDDVRLYCENVRQGAADARVAWQARALQEMEARIEGRLAELAAQRQEFEAWLARRESFLKRAEEGVVNIYSRMNAEAAAAQLSAMDQATASAIIVKLAPRQAGAILNEMEPGRAAQLARQAAGTARKEDRR